MQQPSLIKHIRDILILPFTVSVIIPYLIYNSSQRMISSFHGMMAVGAVVYASGLSLFLYTVLLFKNFGKGTLAPWTPTQTLVIKGPYKYCRNPMITGVFFMLAGETLFFNSTNLLIWTCSFLLINTIYFILKEEPDLEKRFGEAYRAYKKAVPRWIPSIKPYRLNS